MSAHAQVTEAHRESARLITWQNLPHNEIAQIIADSEARAVAEAGADAKAVADLLKDAQAECREAVTQRDQLRAEAERLKAQAPSHEQRFAAHQSESAACLEIYNEWQAERFQSACNSLAAYVRQQAHISANAEYAIVLLEQAVKEKNDAIKLAEDEQDRAVHLRGLLEAPHADTALADERAIEIALLKQSSVQLGEELARANLATDDALADCARADARTIKAETELAKSFTRVAELVGVLRSVHHEIRRGWLPDEVEAEIESVLNKN